MGFGKTEVASLPQYSMNLDDCFANVRMEMMQAANNRDAVEGTIRETRFKDRPTPRLAVREPISKGITFGDRDIQTSDSCAFRQQVFRGLPIAAHRLEN